MGTKKKKTIKPKFSSAKKPAEKVVRPSSVKTGEKANLVSKAKSAQKVVKNSIRKIAQKIKRKISPQAKTGVKSKSVSLRDKSAKTKISKITKRITSGIRVKKAAGKKVAGKKVAGKASALKQAGLKTNTSVAAKSRSVSRRGNLSLGDSGHKVSFTPLAEEISAGSSKYELGIRQQVNLADLPRRYFDNRIVALARDPWWIFVYWDLSPRREKQVLDSIPDIEKPGLKRVLRVYDVSGIDNFQGSGAHSFFDIEINDLALNWYINTNRPGVSFCVEIGFLSRQGNFYLLARSNIISTPYFGISDVVDEEWILPDDDYFKVLGIYDLGRSSFQRKKTFEEIFKRQVSSWAGSGLSSFAGRQAEKKREFFLDVHTEIIIYGRTEPDASLTLNGAKVDLQKDGTFSARFYLPLGDFKFAVEAVSFDKEEKIKITPVVKRDQE